MPCASIKMNILYEAGGFNAPNITFERTMRELFPKLMPSLNIEKVNMKVYYNGYLQLLIELKKQCVEWRSLIDKMRQSIAQCVSFDETGESLPIPAEEGFNDGLFSIDTRVVNHRLQHLIPHLGALGDDTPV